MKLVFFLLALAAPSFGDKEKVFYHFDRIDNDIALPVFDRYVKPQLRSIVGHYFSLLKSVEPNNAKMLKLKELLDKSNGFFGSPLVGCSAERSKDCPRHLTDAAQIHYSIDDEINSLFGSLIASHRGKPFNGDQFVIFRHRLSQFFKENLAIMQGLEEMLLLSHTPYPVRRGRVEDLRSRRHALGLNFDQLTTLLLPEGVHGDFSALYLNFIKSLDRYVIEEGQDSYLMGNLEKLNNVWNAFHMKMTKSAIELDKESEDAIGLIHQRWNSVLKLLLRRWDSEEEQA